MTKTERLRRLAELAGVRVIRYTDIFGADQLSYPHVYWHMEDHFTFRPDHKTNIEWTLETELGCTWIANMLMQGPNWDHNLVIRTFEFYDKTLFTIWNIRLGFRLAHSYNTWGSAVIAAMEGKE
jgi:hypothetical protein